MNGISYWHEAQKLDLPEDLKPEDTLTVLEGYSKLDAASFVAGYVIMKHIKGAVPGSKTREKTLEILDQAVKDGKVKKSGAIAAGCVATDLYKLTSS